MKQRINHVFYGLIKSRMLASIFSAIGYGGLVVIYYIIRVFKRGRSYLGKDSAKSILMECSPKPMMKCQRNNKDSVKDLSIIIPVYNSEKTINKCITSIVKQITKYDYEIIVVNDGSQDRTRSIVEQVEDRHIKLINQENRGFSGARNRGIDESIGRYIMFLDSDDYLVGDCIDNMMDNIISEDADIVQGSYFSFIGEENNRQDNILKARIIENNQIEMVSNPGFPWAKIYRRELFEKVRFPMDVWFEDTIVCMLLYRMCTKMVVTDEIVYAYRINPEGITKRARHSNKCIDHYWVMEYVLDKSHELGLPDDEIQYGLVSGHMSTLLYRRISLMDKKVIESAFILACEMLDKIRPEGYISKGNFIHRDIEKAFQTRNFKLWKLASFIV